MTNRKRAIILGLLAAFAFGDLFGPTDTVTADFSGSSQIHGDLVRIGRAVEQIARNTR